MALTGSRQPPSPQPQAQIAPSERRLAPGAMLRRLGPGLITGAADDDPSGIGTYSVTGAQFGYSLLWLTPVCLPLMIAVQEMCGRVGAVTSTGLAAIIKEHYPRWLLFGTIGLLFFANTLNVWADLNVMAASAQMLFGLPMWLWLTVMAGITLVLQIYVPYRVYVRFLKWLCLALLAYVVTGLLPAVHHNWPMIARRFIVPTWSGGTDYVMTIVAFLGTTISPYLFFWQAGETVEEQVATGHASEPGKPLRRLKESELRLVRADTIIGMAASQAITFFIIICAADTLHARGITNIETAKDAAKALLPLGRAAYWLFTAGIVGTGLLAVPTLAGSAAYAVAETAGWRYGLYRGFRRARGFYLTIGAIVVVAYLLNFFHGISPVKGLYYSAVVNGVIAPPLIVVLLHICNNRRIMGECRNGKVSNTLGWIAVLLMGAAAIFMFWAMFTGKAS